MKKEIMKSQFIFIQVKFGEIIWSRDSLTDIPIFIKMTPLKSVAWFEHNLKDV